MAKKKLHSDIVADITDMAKAHRHGLATPPEVVQTVEMARAHSLSWKDVTTIVQRHFPDWALSQASLCRRSKREGWSV